MALFILFQPCHREKSGVDKKTRYLAEELQNTTIEYQCISVSLWIAYGEEMFLFSCDTYNLPEMSGRKQALSRPAWAAVIFNMRLLASRSEHYRIMPFCK